MDGRRRSSLGACAYRDTGQAEKQFEDRMYTYNYRLYDQFKRPVASFAILSDDSPIWRPSQFQQIYGAVASTSVPYGKIVRL